MRESITEIDFLIQSTKVMKHGEQYGNANNYYHMG